MKSQNQSLQSAYAVIDLETTGLNPSLDEILEIAVIQLDYELNTVAKWSTLIKPSGKVQGTKIHGITDDDVKDAPSLTEVSQKLLSQIRGKILVAHNANFDSSFLQKFSPVLPAFKALTRKNFVCTMEQSYLYTPPGSHSLFNLAKRLGLPNIPTTQHRAEADASVTAELFRWLVTQESQKLRFLDTATNRQGAIIYPASWKYTPPFVPVPVPEQFQLDF
ncbi:MAG: 3'-5' exonuclease [Arcanobacterium sp.]|nr:3'-5' exonuclease [Arcanobacterium sp.]